MEKKNSLLTFVERFDIDKLTQDILNLIDAAAEGQTHQFRNQLDEANIISEIKRRNDAIARLQAILATHGEADQAHVEDYIANGTTQAEDKAVSEAQEWIKRSAAPSYLHDTIIGEARRSVDQSYYTELQGSLEYCQNVGVNLLEDIDYEKGKWVITEDVEARLYADHTQLLDSRQVSDMLLWHAKDRLAEEFNRRGYVAAGAFGTLPTTPQALAIIHNPQLDYRNK